MEEKPSAEMTYLVIYSTLRAFLEEGKISKETFNMLNLKSAELHGCTPIK